MDRRLRGAGDTSAVGDLFRTPEPPAVGKLARAGQKPPKLTVDGMRGQYAEVLAAARRAGVMGITQDDVPGLWRRLSELVRMRWMVPVSETRDGCEVFVHRVHVPHALPPRSLPKPTTTRAATALAWLAKDTRLSLEHYSPVYGDDDDQSVEWRVHRVNGSINDREWDVIGRGATPLEAIESAMEGA